MNYLRSTLSELKGFKLPSADTILRCERELSTEIKTYKDTKAVNTINANEKMNNLLMELILHLGLIENKEQIVVDFDHQFLPCEKQDAKKGYKHEKGYFPGVASIQGLPFYIENRGGNSSVKYRQLDTIKTINDTLKTSGFKSCIYRMDSGSYISDVLELLDQPGTEFVVRATKSNNMLFEASLIEDWKDVLIKDQSYQVGEMDHEFKGSTYRMICYRKPNKTGQVSMQTSDAYTYSFIITNNKRMTPKETIVFYNQRGASEKLFDIQNNDFNWSKMPHNKMEYNTVYLTVMAMANVVFQWVKNVIANKTDLLQKKDRIKRFIFKIICIPAKITYSARQKIVTIFSDNRFSKIAPG